jgi:hypothetical protein
MVIVAPLIVKSFPALRGASGLPGGWSCRPLRTQPHGARHRRVSERERRAAPRNDLVVDGCAVAGLRGYIANHFGGHAENEAVRLAGEVLVGRGRALLRARNREHVALKFVTRTISTFGSFAGFG